jgi:hypothetical protein
MATATATGKKITLATVKSFIRKNRSALLIKTASSFCGMNDCVMPEADAGFSPAQDSDRPCRNNFGVHAVWFVGGSRDWFEPFADNGLVGFRVLNCCGTFYVAVRG